MANMEQKQIAGNIIAGFLKGPLGGAMFSSATPKEQQFEALWDRVLAAVSKEK